VLWAFYAPRWIGGGVAGAAIKAEAPILAAAYRARDAAGKRILAFWSPGPRSAQADRGRGPIWHWREWVSGFCVHHEDAFGGGAGMWEGLGMTSMMSIGAPQCRQTKTCAVVAGSLVTALGAGSGALSNSGASARLVLLPMLASRP